jgi:hypothetical protein
LESLLKNSSLINPLHSQICNTIIQSSPANNNKLNNDDDLADQAGLLRFNIPEHTPIIFSEVAGRTLYRVQLKDISSDTEKDELNNVMPLWIIDALVNKTLPKINRLVFILNPYNQSVSKVVNK